MSRAGDRLWGRLADYELLRVGEAGPVGASDVTRGRSSAAIRSLLEQLLAEYPGNRAVLGFRMQRKLTWADEDLVEYATRLIASGHWALCEVRHRRSAASVRDVPGRRVEPAHPRGRGARPKTWIGVGVLDQFGEPLPWMRAWLTLPDGRREQRILDGGARTHAGELEQAGACTFEVRGAGGASPGPAPRAFDDVRVGTVEPTWIGLRVVDQFGEEVPHLRVRAAGPDASVERTCDDRGWARLYPLACAGMCRVEVLGRGVEVVQ